MFDVNEISLTQLEMRLLGEANNLTDSHLHTLQFSAAEIEAIKSLPEIFLTQSRENMGEITETYLAAFFRLHRQSRSPGFSHNFQPSASHCFGIIADYLLARDIRRVSLVSPCIDNLPDILRNHVIRNDGLGELVPIHDEHLINDRAFKENVLAAETDAIFLILPNNPTGTSISRTHFMELARYCKENEKLLIVDASLRSYLPRNRIFDMYGILAEMDVDAIIIEDTGKTWSTHELKGAFISASGRVQSEIKPSLETIQAQYVLNPSPLVLAFLTRLIEHSIEHGIDSIAVAQHNKEELSRVIRRYGLGLAGQGYNVGWINTEGKISGEKLAGLAAQEGVHILSGKKFFWDRPEAGADFVRIALGRDRKRFHEAVRAFEKVLAANLEPVSANDPGEPRPGAGDLAC